jgi:hypothetical protein
VPNRKSVHGKERLLADASVNQVVERKIIDCNNIGSARTKNLSAGRRASDLNSLGDKSGAQVSQDQKENSHGNSSEQPNNNANVNKKFNNHPRE